VLTAYRLVYAVASVLLLTIIATDYNSYLPTLRNFYAGRFQAKVVAAGERPGPAA